MKRIIFWMAGAGISVASATASATSTNWVSQCDNCNSLQAQQKIIAANRLLGAENWYSINGVTGSVLKFSVNISPDNPGTPAQKGPSGFFFLQPQTNDGMFDDVARKGSSYYNTGPSGWVKTLYPDGTQAAVGGAMMGFTPRKIKPNADPIQTTKVYPDPAVNIYNSIDAGSPQHNGVINWANNQPTGILTQAEQTFQSLLTSITTFQVNGTSFGVSNDWQTNLYLTVPFQDGSKLSLQYTTDGWQTDPRFGFSTDSNGNSVPVTADQVTGPVGTIHRYDYSAKVYPTNPSDLSNFGSRAGGMIGQAPPTFTGPLIGCTQISGGAKHCESSP